VGVVVRNFATELADAVRTMLAPENYQRYRARAAAMDNSADGLVTARSAAGPFGTVGRDTNRRLR